MSANFQFDPTVPFLFVADKKDEMLQVLRRFNEEAAIRKFILVFPVWNGEAKQLSAMDAYEKFGDLLLEVRERVAADGIEVGWWCAPSLSVGPHYASTGEEHPFQRIIGIDGAISNTANCPLDTKFKAVFSSYMLTVVSRGKPPIIYLEDDYRISNHDIVQYGCFCPLHIDRFNQAIGAALSRSEIEAIFRQGDEQSAQYRKIWAKLMKDSLVELSDDLRAAVDEVAPETRMALCQPGTGDFDGDLTEAVAKSLAGGTRPLVRLFGSDYNSDTADNLPATTFHFLYSKQTLSEDFELIHESDPYPHSRFYFSATKLKSLVTLAMFYGLDSSLFYLTQYTDGPLEEEGYLSMHKESSAFFTELRRSVEGGRIVGPQILYRPDAHAHRPIMGNKAPIIYSSPWASVLGKFGIPYSAASGNGPVLISGEEILDLSEEEIEELFKGSVFLDGLAAFYLTRNGYSDLLGAEVEQMPKVDSEGIAYERLTAVNSWREYTAGSTMYYTDLALAVQNSTNLYRIQSSDSVQVLSEFINELDQVVAPSTVCFTNRLGGRVAIHAYNLAINESAAVYNYKRKEQFRGVIEWLGSSNLPVYVAKHPNVFVSAMENVEAGVKQVAIFNMSLDAIHHLTLMIDASWWNEKVDRLHDDGTWREVEGEIWAPAAEGKFKLIVSEPCTTLQPCILRFTKKHRR